ncbi:MAG: hypothetical protein IPL28_03770 [Chloroflexi bacterium]|nr:hypothetical protein [Chloroflexota bacterium]
MTSIAIPTIKTLYPLALAEGEGVGTAYEYVAKRLVLRPWLNKQPTPKHILLAGLPQKYGSSLDFFLLAHELGAQLTIAETDPALLAKAERALKNIQQKGQWRTLRPRWQLLNSWSDLGGQQFEVAFCSEVLQRLPQAERPSYVQAIQQVVGRWALFCPNADNAAHLNLSGLGGVGLAEVQALFPQCPAHYIDMPPFPPGITRTDSQREQATSGTAEAIAMWGLGYYARAEKWLPTAVRRRYAHIVYALWG